MQEASEVSLGLEDCDLHDWGFIGTALSGLSSNMYSEMGSLVDILLIGVIVFRILMDWFELRLLENFDRPSLSGFIYWLNMLILVIL